MKRSFKLLTIRAGRSFRVASRHQAVFATGIKQVAHRCGLDTPHAVEGADFEGDLPLLEQHTIGVEETELRIVNVGCLGSYSVQLYNLHVAARHEVLPRRNTNVKTPKEKPVEGFGDPVDDFFQGGSNRVASV